MSAPADLKRSRFLQRLAQRREYRQITDFAHLVHVPRTGQSRLPLEQCSVKAVFRTLSAKNIELSQRQLRRQLRLATFDAKGSTPHTITTAHYFLELAQPVYERMQQHSKTARRMITSARSVQIAP